MKLLQSMTMRQRLTLGAAALGVVVVAYLLFSLATRPSYSMIATGLDPAKTGKMTAALDAQGIPYELRNNGTALAVEKAKTAQAEVALAGQGLSAGGASQPGFELLDQQKLGSSSFQQKVAYQRALEGQIAQTIGQVSGVSGAQVQLTLPEDQLFADQSHPATAAVLLSGDASTLAPGAVRGIANLVASSVEGLKTSNVTITDGSGQMLWPTGQAGDTATLSKPDAEARYDSDLQTSLNAMLARTLGPGKAQVQVNADLNVDQTTLDKLQYAKKGTPLSKTAEREKLRGKGGGGGAGAGTTANIPGYAAAGGSAGGNSNYQNKKSSIDFAVGKTVTRTKVAPGAVRRLGVALLVDKSVPRAEVAALRSAVASAAGLQPKRGDALTVSRIGFAPVPKASTGIVPSGSLLGYAKYVLLGIASLIFLFFITRHLRRREDEVLVEPTWLRQLDAPVPVAQLRDDQPTAVLAPGANPRREQVEQTVQRDPERVAGALRSWMAEDQDG